MENNGIAAVNRAVDILEFIHARGGECSVTEIANGLGLYKSSVHRMLSTLKARNFLYQDERTGRYGLGTRLFILGHQVGENMALIRAIRPIAFRLSQKYNECVHITMPYTAPGPLPMQLLMAKITNPNASLTFSPPEGSVTCCHASASGKCILAFSPEWTAGFRGTPLPQLTANTITSWDELDRILTEVRSQGWATEDGETELGLSCTAAPCVDPDGTLRVVISISGPTSRMRAHDQQALIRDLQAAASEIVSSIS